MNVYLSGVFDLFHIGHLNILKRAGAVGSLIVGVNTDELVEGYKGYRPTIPYKQRKQIVENQPYVRRVVPQTVLDDLENLKQYEIKILAIGGDWGKLPNQPAVRKYCKENGIKIVRFPYTEGISTTLIKEAIKHDQTISQRHNSLPQ